MAIADPKQRTKRTDADPSQNHSHQAFHQTEHWAHQAPYGRW